MHTQSNLIEYQNITKSYHHDAPVIKDFSLNIKAGDFVSLVGPSGSGKTTLLMLLAGFESFEQGNILLKGQPIKHLPIHKRNFGVVFQDYALFPHMTVGENIAYPLRMRRMPQRTIEKSVLEQLESMKLGGYYNRSIHSLSGGQKQRVALARSLVFKPEVLLLDEPLSALDKTLQHEMQYELRALQKQLGITFIYVTHNQTEALVMSDKIAVLDQGELQQYAAPKLIYTQPANSFVATFFGDNNLLVIEDFRNQLVRVLSNQSMDGSISSDQLMYFSIRPEDVSIAVEKSPNLFSQQCRIDSVIFIGSYYRLTMVILKTQSKMVAHIPVHQWSSGYRLDQVVWVNWSLDKCAWLRS